MTEVLVKTLSKLLIDAVVVLRINCLRRKKSSPNLQGVNDRAEVCCFATLAACMQNNLSAQPIPAPGFRRDA